MPDVVREQMKSRAIELRKAGKAGLEIARILGVHFNTVYRWFRDYDKQGKKSLVSKKRGRPHGACRTLSEKQELEIQKKIEDKMPEQMKLPFALWTRKAVMDLILHLYGIQMPIRTVGEYLSRWGFTPQRPLKRAYEQNPSEVRQWLKKRYPEIVKRCKRQRGEIHWCDETGVRSDANYGRGYAPAGETPVISRTTRRFSTNMISSITNQGLVRFMVYDGSFTKKVFLSFAERLLKGHRRKVFLIADNLRAHRSHDVVSWFKKNRKRIEIHHLPPYSPELNPDEYVNRDVKQAVAAKPPARKPEELKQQVVSHMRHLQKRRDRAVGFFKNKNICYSLY